VTAQSAGSVSMAPPSVTMSEDEMRRGLADMKKEVLGFLFLSKESQTGLSLVPFCHHLTPVIGFQMSDSTSRIVKARVDPLYNLLYITLGILGFLTLMIIWTWWSMPSNAGIASLHQPTICHCPTVAEQVDPGTTSETPFSAPSRAPASPTIALNEDDKKYSCLET